MATVHHCGQFHRWNFFLHFNQSEYGAAFPAFLARYAGYWRDTARLASLAVPLLAQLFLPLVAKHIGNHTNDQQHLGWTKNMKYLSDMVHTNLMSFLHDVQAIEEQIQNYKIEEDKNNPGKYFIRRPLLEERLLAVHGHTPFRDAFGAPCATQLANASKVLALADSLYTFPLQNWFRRKWLLSFYANDDITFIDEEWGLADQSAERLSVDSDCLQLLVDALDAPTCPLALPPGAAERRRQCRLQLWEDLALRPRPAPVTSYLAYTQRAAVDVCLLAWMVANPHGICQDIPFSITKSVREAHCHFHNPNSGSCLQSNATDTICYISRAIMFLKCRDFSTVKPIDLCSVVFNTDGSPSLPLRLKMWGEKTEHSQRTMVYKFNATLKYKDFKIESLKPLEISFIAVNIFFRILTAGVYVCLPRLRNLPGKLLLCFQATGLAQILCSEVARRVAGVPGLSAAVLVDGALTLLGCLWLNTFCYQMYACVRHLRLPDDLLPAEANQIFHRQVVCVLVPCSAVCAACSALEITSKHYLFYSRIIIVIGITLSVAFNLACLALVAYMYLRTRKSMRQLRIYNNNKSASKQDAIFISVKTVIFSGIGTIIRIGFHQAQGIAQFVYYLHIVTMLQGPVLFVLFVCNGTILPVLKNKVLAWLNSDTITAQQELCSAAERNLERRANEQPMVAESSV